MVVVECGWDVGKARRMGGQGVQYALLMGRCGKGVRWQVQRYVVQISAMGFHEGCRCLLLPYVGLIGYWSCGFTTRESYRRDRPILTSFNFKRVNPLSEKGSWNVA